ncbi:MAG TPA: RsmD family RNA methyltransferase [Polyangiaceae bacterium]|nr:RsmD family RNA methyltransferase [Polyangiaceae bacterium]
MPGGAGMCRLPDGSVGFVEGAYPGDTVKPLAIVRKKDYARATRFQLVQASPERVPAVCPVVDACGGCDWMKLERSAELREKASIVAQALERTGGVRLAAVPVVVTAGNELGYRSRVRLHVDDSGRVGFFARGTHTLVEVPGCPVAEPEVERGIACVRALASEAPGALARFESVEVRASEQGALSFVVHPREAASPERAGRDEALVLERLRAYGAATISRQGAEFTQVNRAVNALLVAHVVDGALSRGVRTFVDLYSGSGNFAVPLARAGMMGVAVESDASAATHARERAEAEAPGKLTVLAKDVARGLVELSRAKRTFDLAVLDPPRTGAKDALAGLAALEPRSIAYVACDPVTLARDLRVLGEKGWDLAGLTCFDMFPKTHHVETLVWLERRAFAT